MTARAALGVVLAVCLALWAWGLRWGLPSAHGWAPDEVLPADVDGAVARGFAQGWHSKYPPLHFLLLAVAGAPVEAVGRWTGADAAAVRDARMTAGRALSLLMAAGVVVCLYRCGREQGDPLAGALAGAVMGLSVPFVYYAKTANLDVPYLFWAALSLLFLLRALGRGRPRDFAVLGLAAAAAVATKDQAYGLYLLTVPYLVLHLARRRDAGAEAGTVLADRRLRALAVSGVAGFLVLGGVLWNPSGFRDHVALITGSASADFRMFEGGPGGRLEALWQGGRHLAFTLGGPALAAAGAGLVLAWRERAGRLLALLVPAASYVLSFLLVVLYVYDRFLLPVALVLALFAGLALARAFRARSGLVRAAAALVLVSVAARAVGVDLLLARDARYAAEEWLRREVGPGPLVAAVGPLEYLPRLDGLRWRRLGPSAARLAQVGPEVVVINADYATRADEGTGERAFYRRLADGSLGYAEARRLRAQPPPWLLDTAPLRREDPLRIWSNLDKASPEIVVYRRAHAH